MTLNRVPGFFALLSLCCLAGCESAPEEPEPKRLSSPSEVKQEPETHARANSRPPERKTTPTVPVSPDDPLQGKFTLKDATAGLTGTGPLTADIVTSLGTLTCTLFDDKAPITVANFVGLARGLRPWKKDGEWVKAPAYEDSSFHRIIKGFMIQGGDPTGTGKGDPGYVIPDEIWDGAKHDKRGLLCMANRGPNTNGMQFFITDAAAPHLDKGYTIFGECGPDKLIEKLASVKTRGQRPVTPPTIKTVKIRRAKQ